MRDDYTKELLKIGTIGINKKRSISKIAFLELKKYKPDVATQYNRKRWLEFFGNWQYTQEPGNEVDAADFMLDMRNWTKEERDMYDARTRMLDHQWATYEAARRQGAQLGFEEGRSQGIAQGLEKGLEQGLEKGLEQGLEKGLEQGIEQGIEQGLERGRKLGEISVYVNFVKDGLITKEQAIERLGISEEEFEEYMNK